jgi:hypothetical protein
VAWNPAQAYVDLDGKVQTYGWGSLFRWGGYSQDTAWQQRFTGLQDLIIILEGSVCSIAGKEDAFEHMFNRATIDLTPKRLKFELRDCVCGNSFHSASHDSELWDCFTFVDVLRRKIHLKRDDTAAMFSI